MANIIYKTDYYTNVYLLYLDNVPIVEVIPVLPGLAGAEQLFGETPTVYGAIDNIITTRIGVNLTTPLSPVRAGGIGVVPTDTGYRGG